MKIYFYILVITDHIILALGWVIFCLLHSIFASLWFKKNAERWMGARYKFYRFYYTVFGFLSFGGIMLFQFMVKSSRIFETSILSNVAGGILVLSGLTIMSICIRKYFMRLTGLKTLIENKTDQQLMITGIHKHVRHPLYSGTFLFIWGLFLLLPNWSILVADIIITVYTLIALRFEEQKLEKDFGEAYRIYKQKVPMLIPKAG